MENQKSGSKNKKQINKEIENPKNGRISWSYKSSGIPDDQFIRGNIPMTKEEIRVITVSKLRIREKSVIYDIGAGTGSISIEAALIAQKGKVYAVERENEGIKLIEQNKKKFCLSNIEIIKGEAPSVLNELPSPDRVMIGGSGGNLKEILDTIAENTETSPRIVINAVTVNTLSTAFNYLQNNDYDFDICHISVSKNKDIANYKMLKSLNPVYIISAQKS